MIYGIWPLFSGHENGITSAAISIKRLVDSVNRLDIFLLFSYFPSHFNLLSALFPSHFSAMASAPPSTSCPAQKTFTVGTRSSKLALLQTDLVIGALKKACPDCEFQILSKETAGDKNTTIAFREFTTKNLWTEELEELLVAGKVDLIVHSLKGTIGNFIPYQQTLMYCLYFTRCSHPNTLLVYFGSYDEARRQEGRPRYEEGVAKSVSG